MDITKYKSIKDVPEEEIHARSGDGKVLLLKDGTRVSDELIKEARAKKAAEASAAASAEAATGKLAPEERAAIIEEAKAAALEDVNRMLAEGGKSK